MDEHLKLRGCEGPLRFGAFVPAQQVNQYLADPCHREEAITLFRASQISKVYLDCLRGGHFPGEEALTEIRDVLQNQGFGVAAGLTPTRGTGKASTHGRWWLCYTNADTQAELEDVVRRTARLFDEIIVDDFLCTHCQCQECQQARGHRDWGEYYRDLLVQVAQERIIGPSREENPNVQVIIKYPQWYDRFHVFGYDVRHHPEQFDGVWVGTEIRDPRVEYVHQYQAFANYQWLASLSGSKIGGAWFDFINCYPAIYVEQAVQSILAGARELIRFHYDPSLYSPENPNTQRLLQAIPSLQKLAETLDGLSPQGIAFYKPVDTDGEDEAYLLDYLGMLGLPIVPCHTFPSDAEAICLPVQAADDPDVVGQAIDFVENGGTLLLTPGFLSKLAYDTRVLHLAGYAWPPTTAVDQWTYQFAVSRESVSAEAHIHFGAQLHPVTAETLAAAIHADGNLPVLTRLRHGQGSVLVLNAKTFRYPEGSERVTTAEPVSLPHLPPSLVDLLRAELTTKLPFQVQVCSRVGVYWYGSVLVLTNFNDQEATATVTLREPHNGAAVDSVTEQRLGEWSDGVLTCKIPERTFVTVQIAS